MYPVMSVSRKIVQGLSLTDECLQHHSIILHLLMHALGFWHETTRADRDKYIKINWNNINPKFIFHSMSWKALHYDGDSILHFSQRSFAIDNDVRKPTFVFVDGDQVLGKRLSERPTKLSQLLNEGQDEI
ncbi:Astacin-like metalloendopeptidase [Armadillidium vulgare]|nr:Astacin-like metalloendopeptidase [Armadillidium vulgare]